MSTGWSKKKKAGGTAAPIRDLSGKNPISALMELCTKKKWDAPDFLVVDETGPGHQRNFLFKVGFFVFITPTVKIIIMFFNVTLSLSLFPVPCLLLQKKLATISETVYDLLMNLETSAAKIEPLLFPVYGRFPF